MNTLIQPNIQIFHKTWPSFYIFGGVGFILGTLLTTWLAWKTNLSPSITFALAIIAVFTFLTLAMLTKIIIGTEQLICYHQQITVISVAALALNVLGQPILAYLDLVILGVALFTACGRIGCLMVGCCHGRPHRWGVCYHQAHLEEGFPAYLVGVRLFPVQTLEMGWLFAIVAVGSGFILSGFPPGTAFSWHFIVYALGRFFFEFLRGDPQRPYWRGFSEAQWTAVISTWLITIAAFGGLLPMYSWQLGGAIVLTLALIFITWQRQQQLIPTYQLLHVSHIEEIAQALNNINHHLTPPVSPKNKTTTFQVPITSTSLGIQLSGGLIQNGDKQVQHYTLSYKNNKNGLMPSPVAHHLGDLIIKLKHPTNRGNVISGQQEGVFHLLIE